MFVIVYCLGVQPPLPQLGDPPDPSREPIVVVKLYEHECDVADYLEPICGVKLQCRKGKSVFRVQVRCSCSYSVEYELDVADYLKPICGVRKQCMSKQ